MLHAHASPVAYSPWAFQAARCQKRLPHETVIIWHPLGWYERQHHSVHYEATDYWLSQCQKACESSHPKYTKDITVACETAVQTWFLAEPCITMDGLTGSGGTGNTVMIIQSGLVYSGLNPSTLQSSSDTLLNISCTRSADNVIFLSCDSSFSSFHSAVNSMPVLRYWGWFLPHPPGSYRCNTIMHVTSNDYIITFEMLTFSLSNLVSTTSPPSQHFLFLHKSYINCSLFLAEFAERVFFKASLTFSSFCQNINTHELAIN